MIVDLVNFIFYFGFLFLCVQKFLSYSLFDFSANLDPNQVIFDSMDSSLILFPNLSKYLISHQILLSDLIELQKISQKSLISPWIRPYSALYFLICDNFIKFVSLVLVLTRSCVNSMTTRNHFFGRSDLFVVDTMKYNYA